MYKVLIVEDMDITREDIIGLIEWEKYGFELLPSARNGKIGLEYAMRYQPDIILTDIKMPVMTGLDMIEEIRKHDRQVKVVLLTAYEEFELAKRALEMNVQSFVLKYEIDRELLLGELNKLVEMIKRDRDIEKITLRHGLEKLLSDTGGEEYVEERYFQWIGQSVLLDIWQLRLRSEINDENLLDMLKEELAEYRFVFLKISSRESIIFLRIPSSHSEMERELYVRAFILSLQHIFEHMLGTGTAVSIGGIVRNNRDIGKCRKKAAESLSLRIFYKGSCILNHDRKECSEEVRDKAGKKLDKIRNKIRDNEFEEAGAEIRNLFYTELAQSQDVALLQKTAVKLVYFFREKGYEMELAEFDEYLERVTVNLLTDSIYHTEERFAYLLLILEESMNMQYSRKIRGAMAYIRKHYGEDVGLNEAADFLDVSPIYLSHLFKKETGMTFSAYVTKVRMERAKELLRQGDRKIYEISEMVGYQTVQYFSKVFKRETGKTPKEFE